MRTKVTLGIILAVAGMIMGCQESDVVAKFAASSFGETEKKLASAVRKTADSGGISYWEWQSPGGDTISFSTDFSKTADDVIVTTPLAPFVAAGLDPAKLAGSKEVRFSVANERLALSFSMGDSSFPAESAGSSSATFRAILKSHRDRVGYHAALDHYGIALGGGNMFEWAKDLSKNDKDIVFVLDPKPFLAAGMDPAKAAPWAFLPVEMMDGGKKVLVDKLLRPYDL